MILTETSAASDRWGMTERQTMTVDEVSEVLGVSRNGVYEALRKGEVPGVRVGRRWVIPRERFWRWFKGEEEIKILESRIQTSDEIARMVRALEESR